MPFNYREYLAAPNPDGYAKQMREEKIKSGGDIPTVWRDCAHCGARVLRGPVGSWKKRPDFCSERCWGEYGKRPKLEIVPQQVKRSRIPRLEDL